MTQFRVTKLRRDLLAHFATYKYLTTEHVYHLVAGNQPSEASQRNVRRALTEFTRSGHLLLERVFLNQPNRSNQQLVQMPYIYWLSRSGVELARKVGLKAHENGARSISYLPHECEITDFHLALSQACDQNSLRLHWYQHDLRRTVNPDALFAITYPDRSANQSTFYFFLEIERSKQGNYINGQSGLIRKLARYERYRRTRECLKDWRYFDDYRVIVVVKNEDRQLNLLRALEKNLSSAWIANFQAFCIKPLGSIFQSAHDCHRSAHSLAEV